MTRGGETYGPYTWEQIAEHARGGRIGRGDKIFDPRNGAWMKPSKVPGLFGPGGVATVPVGISAAAKAMVGLIISMAVIMGLASIYLWNYNDMDSEFVKETYEGIMTSVQSDVPVAANSAQEGIPPEGLAFKGTFTWEDEYGFTTDPCYLYIYNYTPDDVTIADFDFGIVDGWPLYLVSQSGTSYTFRMSDRSTVGKVQMTVNIVGDAATGNITNIDWVADSFKQGSFTTTAITYEEYKSIDP